MQVRIPIPCNTFLPLEIDVVDASVPLLIGLDILDLHALVPDNVENMLINKKFNWSIPITRKFGHMYLEWDFYETLYTKSELRKMHMHFYHPSASKLFNLISRAKPENATPETRKLIERISKSCATCQRFTPRPQSFQVSVPGKIIFNSEIALDLMFLDKIPVLHVVDTQTHFSSAVFLKTQTTEAIWYAFLSCWATLYTGYPDRMKLDKARQFTSARWKELTSMAGITLHFSGVESHNSLGPGERYHEPLRRIYQKIRYSEPDVPIALALRLAVKAMNDTVNPEGLVPSLLVFGVLPRFPPFSTELPNHEERMRALQLARTEMETITSELRLRRAIVVRIPSAAATNLKVGQEVLVYRENLKPIKWTGPYKIVKIDDKQIYINRNGETVQHSIAQVKPFYRDELMNNLHICLQPILPSDFELYDVQITEVLGPSDERRNLPAFSEAKRKELAGLISRGTWKVIRKDEVSEDANILTDRFVLAIKNPETDEEIFKARFVAQGHKDPEKPLLVHNSPNLRQYSTRILVTIAAILGYRVWNTDVRQAYLQSAQKLMRKVYLKPPKELVLPPEMLLELLRPLYGLSDSGDYWYRTINTHLKEDLGMKPTKGDLSLFMRHEQSKLIGLTGVYVDDLLQCGNEQFLQQAKRTVQKFESKDLEMDCALFAGVRLRTMDKGFSLSQKHYTKRLRILPKDCTFSDFRSLRHKLAWLTHTRPDICCAVNMAAQVTEPSFSKEDVKNINKVVTHIQQTQDVSLNYVKLDVNSLHLKVYSDSSFANNTDNSSQIGFIILLVDKFEKCNILHFSSHKSRRVTRSVLGGELYAFADAFDVSYVIKHDLESILGKKYQSQC